MVNQLSSREVSPLYSPETDNDQEDSSDLILMMSQEFKGLCIYIYKYIFQITKPKHGGNLQMYISKEKCGLNFASPNMN